VRTGHRQSGAGDFRRQVLNRPRQRVIERSAGQTPCASFFVRFIPHTGGGGVDRYIRAVGRGDHAAGRVRAVVAVPGDVRIAERRQFGEAGRGADRIRVAGRPHGLTPWKAMFGPAAGAMLPTCRAPRFIRARRSGTRFPQPRAGLSYGLRGLLQALYLPFFCPCHSPPRGRALRELPHLAHCGRELFPD